MARRGWYRWIPTCLLLPGLTARSIPLRRHIPPSAPNRLSGKEESSGRSASICLTLGEIGLYSVLWWEKVGNNGI